MGLTLANINLVISGAFGGLDPDDVHWDLVARGAYVKKSVTKTTAALIVGTNPEKKHLRGAEKHGTPVVDRAGLDALLGGAPLDSVLAGDTGGPTELEGWKVAIAGKLAGNTKASIASSLERLGARVVGSPSKSCDLLIAGEDLGAEAVETQDAGVPFLLADDLDALLTGTPIAELVAPPGPRVDDRRAAVEAALDALLPQLAATDTAEAWEDQLTLTVRADGRPVLELRDMGGTPIHDRARRIVQSRSWPIGDEELVVERSVTWR